MFKLMGKEIITILLNLILVFRAEIHNMFVRIANREDPDQTALCDVCLDLLAGTCQNS